MVEICSWKCSFRGKMVGHFLLCILLFQTIEAKDAARLPPAPKKLTLSGRIISHTFSSCFGKKIKCNEQNASLPCYICVGNLPEVVARGGYSGFFPDSSQSAYDLALDTSITGTIIFCNLHFTKDNDGFCVSQINLQNATNIEEFDPKGAKKYNINGQEINGYFGLDYPANVIFENITRTSSQKLVNLY